MENISPPRLNKLLKMAVLAGVETAVKHHIKRGDNINACDENGLTPLMLAASRNKFVICRLLLEAGADPRLEDSAGKDALSIAKLAMSSESALIIENAFEVLNKKIRPTAEKIEIEISKSSSANQTSIPDKFVFIREANTNQPIVEISTNTLIDNFEDEISPSYLLDWEEVIDSPPPQGDNTLVSLALIVNEAISNHIPIDNSEEWAEISAFLPEQAVPLPKSRTNDGYLGLKELFLRAFREGSIPESVVEQVSLGDDALYNESVKKLISMVLNEIGAETDGRIELEAPFENQVTTQLEDESVSEAIDFMDDIASGYNDPMRFYVKDFHKIPLLTADDEKFLGQEMEEGAVGALDALAGWDDGLVQLFAVADQVRSGEIDVDLISNGTTSDLGSEENDGEVLEIEITNDHDEDESFRRSTATTDFLNCIDKIATTFKTPFRISKDLLLIKEFLSELSLSKGFLYSLNKIDDSHQMQDANAIRFIESLNRQERALNKMIVSNLRLVFSIAVKFQRFGLSLEDLIQEGNLGLMKAAERFDWRRGFKFSTYATWWIRQSIFRAIADKGKTIRTPVHLHEVMIRLSKLIAEFDNQTSEYPNCRELGKKMGVSSEKIEMMLSRLEEPVSLEEAKVGGVPITDVIEDPVNIDPFISVAYENLRSILLSMLQKLKKQQAEILILRNGLNSGIPQTLEETGKLFGVTRERIRQIEAKALTRLSIPERLEQLEPFLQIDFSQIEERLPKELYDHINIEEKQE